MSKQVTRLLFLITAAGVATACVDTAVEKGAKSTVTTIAMGSTTMLEPGTSAGALEASDSMLDDGTYYDEWTISGSEGERAVVTMRSGTMDSYLIAYDPAGDIVATDDDSGGGLDAQVEFIMDLDGAYVIQANTWEAAEGDYTIELEYRGPRPAISYRLGGDPSERYALVIGVADYAGTASDLPVVAADVDVMVDLLTGRFGFPEENVLVLRDDMATRENILNAALIHLGQAQSGGTALLYYSGHGTQTAQNDASGDPEPDGLDEALAVYDGIILDDEIGAITDRLTADNVLLVFDSCYSGTASRAASNPAHAKFVELGALEGVTLPGNYLSAKGDADSDMLRRPTNHILLAGGAEDQVTFAPPSIGVSSFTYFLDEVMREVGDDASFAEVMAEVHARASDWASGIGEVQDPQAEGLRVGEPIGTFLVR